MSAKSGRLRAWVAALGLFGAVVWVSAGPALAQESGGDGARGSADESFPRLMWRRAGAIEVAIGGMSFSLIALVVWMSFHYRRPVAVPDDLVREVGELLNQKRYSDAYQRLA